MDDYKPEGESQTPMHQPYATHPLFFEVDAFDEMFEMEIV
jgi:hypothetical protein